METHITDEQRAIAFRAELLELMARYNVMLEPVMHITAQGVRGEIVTRALPVVDQPAD